jgi:hypothetical protein
VVAVAEGFQRLGQIALSNQHVAVLSQSDRDLALISRTLRKLDVLEEPQIGFLQNSGFCEAVGNAVV